MFNRSSFSPVSFSRISFNGVQAANEGRSGYWRLFFTNLQEEALKKDEPERRDSSQKVLEETPKVVRKTKIKKSKRPVIRQPELREKVDSDTTIPNPPFRLKPIYDQPNTYDALRELEFLPYSVVNLTRVENRVIINLNQERIKRRKQARRRAAAFLLLAA